MEHRKTGESAASLAKIKSQATTFKGRPDLLVCNIHGATPRLRKIKKNWIDVYVQLTLAPQPDLFNLTAEDQKNN